MIASRYEIVRRLGAGGMGVVFEARDLTLGLRVAIKILKSSSDEAATRFRREIKLAWKVRHKNVGAIHEYGEDSDLLFISMDLIEGRDLRRLLHERGAFSWEEGYELVLQIGAGLEAIHEVGVIHRDLKSANIMIEPSGLARVMDFGIALGGDHESHVTPSHEVVGTPEYMSPEQARGRRLDVRSDLYSFGIVIWEVFTGRLPFRGSSPISTMLMQVEDPLPLDRPETAQIPLALVKILARALAKVPDERYPSCREMNAALRAARSAVARQTTDASPPAVRGEALSSGPASGSSVSSPLETPTPGLPVLEHAPRAARLLVRPLIRALRHTETGVRARAARALATLGAGAGPALNALIEAREDTAWEVRMEAERALRMVAPPASAPSSALDGERHDAHQGTTRRRAPQPPPPPVACDAPVVLAPAPAPRHGAPAPSPPPAIEPRPGPARRASRGLDKPQGEALSSVGTYPAPVPRPTARQRVTLPLYLLAPVAVAILGAALWARMAPPASPPAGTPAPQRPAQSLPAAERPAPLAGVPDATVNPGPSAEPNQPVPVANPLPSPVRPAGRPSPKPRAEPPAGAVPVTLGGAPLPQPTATIQSVPTTTLALVPPATSVALPTVAPPPAPEETPTQASTSNPRPDPSPSHTPPQLPENAMEARATAPVCQRCLWPTYPPLAVRTRTEGRVVLRLLINEEGLVQDCVVVKVEIVTSGLDKSDLRKVELVLSKAARSAVQSWRFSPPMKEGVAVKLWIDRTVQFQLPP